MKGPVTEWKPSVAGPFFFLLGCLEQLLGVGVDGVVKDAVHGVLLHDSPLLHDDHPVAALVDHVQVVGDEEVAQVVLPPQAHEQVQNLVLDGHVQGGDRLVQNHQPGPHDHGRGDGHPLALTAGELGGPAVVELRP